MNKNATQESYECPLCGECEEHLEECIDYGTGAVLASPELVAAVRRHAFANYEKDGWDYIVECYEDDQLAELIGDAQTLAEAIARAGKRAKALRAIAARREW